MLIHKCKLAIISNAEFIKSIVNITINSDKDFTLTNYEGPQFKCGRFCIYNLNSKNEISNFYLLDDKGKPFQVHGKFDLLQEGSVIYDTTKEISKEIAYATQICIHAFNVLFKNEIEENKELLLEIENFIFSYILSNKFGWKANKKNICDLVLSYDLSESLLDKITDAIKIAPMPKIALTKKPNVNLEEYLDSVFVRV
jgi:hypothetical protein